MRYTTLAFGSLIAVFSTSCHGGKDAVKTADVTTATASTPAPVPPAPPATPELHPEEEAATDVQEKAMNDSVYFSIQRTPCFGTCPSYTLTILENGTATYKGGRFAPREGNYVGKVDAETMEKLWVMAEEAGFFGMQDKYDAQVTDLPSTIIRFHGKGKNKEVLARQGTPLAFKNLAVSVEELLAPVQWTLVPGE